MKISAETEYELNITGTSSDGRGIGRIDGMAVFVENAVEGDTAVVKVKRVKKSFAEGELSRLIKPSPRRIEPECPYFGSCGGCRTANTDYDFELEKKSENIEQVMRRIGGFSDFKIDGIESGNRTRYRNKAVYKVSEGACGFYSAKSHNVTGVEDCLLCDERDRKIISAFSAYLCRNKADRGVINELFIRRSKKTDMVMAAVNAESRPNDVKSLAECLVGADENIVSVILNVKNNAAEVLFGREYIEDELLGVRFYISNRSFYQVNPKMTERLYSQVLEYASLTGKERVLDIYCGIGTISLCAAKKAAAVIGVEVVTEAVENAIENARINNIDNAVFFAESAEKIVPKLIESGERPNVVILDPPRRGSDKATLAAVLAAAPERIVYVSCNPPTLARDARILADGGYEICAAKAFDMFPCTVHVECVVLMSRGDK